MIFLIIMLIMCGILAGMYFFLVVKKTPNKNASTSITQTETTTGTQSLLPFHEIDQSMLILKDQKRYRAYLSVSSNDYFLKTDEDKDILEQSFKQKVSSWKFRFAFYIQTANLNIERILQNLEKTIATTLVQNPHLEEYARHYYDYIKSLSEVANNGKIKNKYMIIEYVESEELANFSYEERKNIAYDNLTRDCSQVINNLKELGLTAKRLDHFEIAELIFTAMNKGSYLNFQGIKSGEYLDSIVKAKDEHTKIDFNKVYINDFINKLTVDIIQSRTATLEEKEKAMKLINTISNLKDEEVSDEYAEDNSDVIFL